MLFLTINIRNLIIEKQGWIKAPPYMDRQKKIKEDIDRNNRRKGNLNITQEHNQQQ